MGACPSGSQSSWAVLKGWKDVFTPGMSKYCRRKGCWQSVPLTLPPNQVQ
jgi:hypothetical protein